MIYFNIISRCSFILFDIILIIGFRYLPIFKIILSNLGNIKLERFMNTIIKYSRYLDF